MRCLQKRCLLPNEFNDLNYRPIQFHLTPVDEQKILLVFENHLLFSVREVIYEYVEEKGSVYS